MSVRELDFSNLPTKEGYGCNKNVKVIDWVKSVGKKVPFIYNDLQGEILIVNKKGSMLTIEYNGKQKELSISSFRGCSIGRLVGEYDKTIAQTNPEMIDRFVDKEFPYTHNRWSKEETLIKCPNCGKPKLYQAKSLFVPTFTFSCDNCSSKVSYPNRVIYYLLEELKLCSKNNILKIEKEITFDWAKDKRYDFYITFKDGQTLIIEAHGIQHYKQSFEHVEGRTVQEEQINDAEKCWLAYKNGVDNYIQLDCRKRDIDYIKNNVLNNDLLNVLFDFSNIKWKEIQKKTLREQSKESQSIELWKQGMGTLQISELLEANQNTIYEYIRRNKEETNYNPKDSKRRNFEYRKKQKEVK